MAKLKTDFDRYWKLVELRQLKRKAILSEHYETASRIRDKERKLLKQIEMYDGIFLIEFEEREFEDRYGLRFFLFSSLSKILNIID